MNYPTSPVLIQKVIYKDYYDPGLYLTRFAEKNIPALMIGNEDTQEVYTICNINPENYCLKDFELAIKDYSENEGILNYLIENGFVKAPHNEFISGYVTIPVCYTTEKLKQSIIDICSQVDLSEIF